MTPPSHGAARLTEIVSLLRPERSRKWPEWLGAAAGEGNLAAMQLFLDRGADIEQRGSFTGTPVCCAVSASQHQAVRWLVAHGALLEPKGVPASPMRLALSKADCPMAALLLELGSPLESAAWGAVAAASLGRLDMLRWLLGRGLHLDRSYPVSVSCARAACTMRARTAATRNCCRSCAARSICRRCANRHPHRTSGVRTKLARRQSNARHCWLKRSD